MSTQPEALRLADKLESDQQGIDLGAEGMGWGPSETARTQAAAELRRLYELNQELLKALKWIADHDLHGADLTVCGHIAHGFVGVSRAAIRARGEA